mmetsp:Transcript_52222/g.59674  ORF Transcript_52222/g.59674 Transcript_52222/m.59674 type:complete len:558 (+) Transcript_52222:46-1719(+)
MGWFKTKEEVEKENEITYNTFLLFLRSPEWEVPLNNFADENCIYVEDGKETRQLKKSYTTIHKCFNTLVAEKFATSIKPLGVNKNKFYQLCQVAAIKEEGDVRIFEMIVASKNYSTFIGYLKMRKHQIMLEAHQLELEARMKQPTDSEENPGSSAPLEDKKTEEKTAGGPKDEKEAEKLATLRQKEDEEFARALQASMAEEEIRQETVQAEEDLLKQALQESELEYKAALQFQMDTQLDDEEEEDEGSDKKKSGDEEPKKGDEGENKQDSTANVSESTTGAGKTEEAESTEFTELKSEEATTTTAEKNEELDQVRYQETEEETDKNTEINPENDPVDTKTDAIREETKAETDNSNIKPSSSGVRIKSSKFSSLPRQNTTTTTTASSKLAPLKAATGVKRGMTTTDSSAGDPFGFDSGDKLFDPTKPHYNPFDHDDDEDGHRGDKTRVKKMDPLKAFEQRSRQVEEEKKKDHSESLQSRQERMKAQRDALIQKKKAQREKQLEDFQKTGQFEKMKLEHSKSTTEEEGQGQEEELDPEEVKRREQRTKIAQQLKSELKS